MGQEFYFEIIPRYTPELYFNQIFISIKTISNFPFNYFSYFRNIKKISLKIKIILITKHKKYYTSDLIK